MRSSQRPMPFIVGAPRSGTTLLRMMLDYHPEISIPPETGFIIEVLRRMPINEFSWKMLFEIIILRRLLKREFSWKMLFKIITNFETWIDFHLSADKLAEELSRIQPFTVSDGIRCFYRLYAQRFHKKRFGDKTPNYGLHLKAIGKLLPEAHFIHIIRDGRDVAVSVKDLWFAPSKDFRKLGKDWVWRVETIRTQGKQYPFYIEIRFEDLLTNTESVLKKICSFLEIDYHPQMMYYYMSSPSRLQEHEARYRKDGTILVSKEERLDMQRHTTLPPDLSKIDTWKQVMSEKDQNKFLYAAKPLLAELGYL